MNEIALHIDFLLHTHDCVIVPGLGGFVVNGRGVEKSGLWGLDAPSFEVLFNSKLTYNDGLLAESLMRTNDVSYDVAIKQIEKGCEELKSKLIEHGEVEWDNLGTFKTDKDSSIIFLANRDYVRPQFFGLTNARFTPVALTATTDDDNAIPIKTVVQYVSAAIAAAVVLFFVALSYNNSAPDSQYAEIVSKPLIFSSTVDKAKVVKEAQPIASVAEVEKSVAAVSNNSSSSITNVTEEPSISSTTTAVGAKRYYIIVGVYEVREIAEKSLSRLKSQGFDTASMIERPMRIDVYSASFTTREEAHSYLLNFHKDNPQYKDAWILKR